MCSADSIGLIWVCVLGSVGCMSDLYGVSVGVFLLGFYGVRRTFKSDFHG